MLDCTEIVRVLDKMDRMRAAWPDFRNRVGYQTAMQDLEAACRHITGMPAKPYTAPKKEQANAE
jgi:hypothetical protein